MADIAVSAALSLSLSVNVAGTAHANTTFSISDDLLVVDNLEDVELRKQGEPTVGDSGLVSYPDAESYPVPNAKRSRVSMREVELSSGRLQADDLRFRIMQDLLAVTPSEQWQLIASDGTWQIIAVDSLGHATQWRLYCRR